MSRSIRKETSSLVFGMVGRFGGSSAGFVVAALNAASAASREVVVLRVLSAGILCPFARASLLKCKLGSHTKTGDMSALCYDSCTAANDAQPIRSPRRQWRAALAGR